MVVVTSQIELTSALTEQQARDNFARVGTHTHTTRIEISTSAFFKHQPSRIPLNLNWSL